jgi:hypothetical protein
MKLTPNENEVARLAYAIWEQEGRPHGRDQMHWTEAERLLAARPLSSPTAPRPTLKSASRMTTVRRNSAPAKLLAR